MELKRMDDIIKRVALAEGEDLPLTKVDAAVDQLVDAVETMEENLPKARGESSEQKAALKKVQDLLDNGLSPYVAEVIEAMEVFQGEE